MNADRPRTVRLIEREPRPVRLRRADAAFLAADHSRAIELTPLPDRGWYRLTSRGYAGVIAAPSVRLVLRPKVPLRSLFDLLDADADVAISGDRPGGDPIDGLLPFLTTRLAALLRERADDGLRRAYVAESGPRPFLRGRLDVAEQVRDGGQPRTEFHCEADEFTTDHPLNQFPKAVAEALLTSGLLDDGQQRPLRQALAGFAGVRSVPLARLAGLDLWGGDIPEGYGPLLELCGLIAGALGAGPPDHPRTPSVLIDMERVWEHFLTRAVRDHFAGSRRSDVDAQVTWRLFAVGDGPALGLRPDIVINRRGAPRIVLDAKWKRLEDQPDADDLHQVLAYAATLDAPDVRLVYPGRRFSERAYETDRGRVRVTLHTLRVTGGREACRRSVARLGRSLRRALRPLRPGPGGRAERDG